MRGETPIPCVACNETVKFRDLLGVARDLGAAALATGHYVRRVDGADGPELHRAADRARDQSYFLFRTTRAQLDFLRFPLGGLAKDETRALARRFDLPVAEKPDSQDICFVPGGSLRAISSRSCGPRRPSPARSSTRTARCWAGIDGIIHFTVGQRKGLGIAGAEPLYVAAARARDAPRRRRPARGAWASAASRSRGVNWLGAGEHAEGIRVRR